MDSWLKEKPQLAPFITAMLTMLYYSFNILFHYLKLLYALRSFDISNLYQYTLQKLLLMSDKVHLLLSPHTFKVILDIKKTKKINIFALTVSRDQRQIYYNLYH